jgi:uncharacterized protein (DUF2252 family)
MPRRARVPMLQGGPLDPAASARRELARIRAATTNYPQLAPLKISRMMASPLSYLRGSVEYFYELLTEHPTWLPQLPGTGVLVGDLHVENFGVFRAQHRKTRLVFGLNDFDCTVHGPLVLDLLRLLTSMVVGSRELGTTGCETLDLMETLLDHYVVGLRSPARKHALPRAIAALIARAEARTQREFLQVRTRGKRARRLRLNAQYLPLAPTLSAQVPRMMEEYLQHQAPEATTEFAYQDAVFRIAGTGSLGALRIAVLARLADKSCIFDVKSQQIPAFAKRLGLSLPAVSRGQQVALAAATLSRHPPVGIGWTTLGGLSCTVKQLTPSDDKLELPQVPKAELGPVVAHLGLLVGQAHARAADAPVPAWSTGDRASVIDAAIALAGAHESAYLAFCKQVK